MIFVRHISEILHRRINTGILFVIRTVLTHSEDIRADIQYMWGIRNPRYLYGRVLYSNLLILLSDVCVVAIDVYSIQINGGGKSTPRYDPQQQQHTFHLWLKITESVHLYILLLLPCCAYLACKAILKKKLTIQYKYYK